MKQKELHEIVVSSSAGVYRAAEPKYWDIVHTDIALQPFQKKGNLFLKEAEGEALLKLHPYCYASDSVTLDAQTMDIETVELRKPFFTKPLYRYENDKLSIKFNRKFEPGDTLELYVKYRAKPYEDEAGGSSAISEDRGLYYINNNYEIPGKPKQIWTQGETQANSHWFPTLDQPNEKFTVSISLTVPDSFTTLSNGELVSSKKTNNNNRIDKWEIDQPIQTYAVMFAIGKFSIINDASWKGKSVNYYVEPEYAPYAKMMFRNTPEMIDYFSGITGVNYPWNKYSQVVVRDYVSGAMENTTASLFGEFMNENARELLDKDNENVVSHELFHQWFGDYATAESWSNLTLNESFATYGEQLWRKYKYGKASNDELAYDDLNNYFNQAQDDPELVRYYYNNREDMFDRVSYQKGGAILRYLHGLLGDSTFYKAMNIYLTKNAYGNAEASDWRKAVEEASGTDWNWFFNEWYYKGGHPKLKLEYVYDDANQVLKVTATQTQDSNSFYLLPLKAKLVYNDKQEIIDWKIEKRTQVFQYPYKNGTRPFFIPDAEHWLAGTINESKHAKEWLQQYQASADDYISKKRSINGAFYEQGDAASQTIFHWALKDPMKEIRTYALTLLKRMPDKYDWQKNFKDEVSMLALHDGTNAVRAGSLEIAGKWKLTNMKDEFVNALNDSSYKVAGAALQALSRIDSSAAYEKAKLFSDQQPKAELQDEVWMQVAKAGIPADEALFEEIANTLYGRRKISLSEMLGVYAQRVNDENAYEKTLALVVKMAEAESIKSYRFATGATLFNLQAYLLKNKKEKNAEWKSAIIQKYTDALLKNEQDRNNISKYKQLLD